MASVPTAERPPKGLNAYWTGVWRHALKTLKDQETWAWEQKPLLDEYVYALIAAEKARIAGDVPAEWDRHTKRAAALADQLALTDRGRKAIDLHASDDDATNSDPLAGVDELAARRVA